MFNAKAYAAPSATSPLGPHPIQRRDPDERDVHIEILFCGVCHSDLHTVRNEWASIMPTTYPCVPGHEIAGRVVKVGAAVTKFKPGDLASVGCLVDSDHSCPACKADVRLEGDRIVCVKCGRRYPIKDDIPIMLIDEAEGGPSGAAKKETGR